MFFNAKMCYACIVFSVRAVSHRRAVAHIFVWGRIPHAADPGPPTEGPGHHLGSAQLSSAQLGPPAEAGSAPELSEPGADVAQLGSAWLSSVQPGSARASERSEEAGPTVFSGVQTGSARLSLAQLSSAWASARQHRARSVDSGPKRRGASRFSPAQLGSARATRGGRFCARTVEPGADVAQLGSAWASARQHRVSSMGRTPAQTSPAWLRLVQLRSAPLSLAHCPARWR